MIPLIIDEKRLEEAEKGGSGTVIEGNTVEIKDGRCDHNRK